MEEGGEKKRRKLQHGAQQQPGPADAASRRKGGPQQPELAANDGNFDQCTGTDSQEDDVDLEAALYTAVPLIQAEFANLVGVKEKPQTGELDNVKLKGKKLFKLVLFSWQALGADPIDCQEACIALKASHPEAVQAGMTWSQLRDYLEQAVQALARQARQEEALLAAREQERQGAYADAAHLLAEVLERDPQHVAARMSLARVTHFGASDQEGLRQVEGHYRAAAKAAMAAGAAARAAGDEAGSTAAKELGKLALSKLGLLLCGEGRDEEAAKVLKALGCRYRLASGVLHYSLPTEQPSTAAASTGAAAGPAGAAGAATAGAAAGAAAGEGGAQQGSQAFSWGCDDAGAGTYVAAVDGVLPAPLLQHMQHAFAPGGPFWREHSYDVEHSSYFSYVHELTGSSSSPAGSTMDLYIRHIQATAAQCFPQVSEARYAEWWAHCRPHASGHQLHFDSENEGRGRVHNPILSTVMYLSEGTGGPTLVTTQPFGSSRLAERGWMVHPRINRLTMFDGRVLHGVVPGHGPSPLPGVRRVTLMVAFWRSFTVRAGRDGQQGPSRPFPASGASRFYTWNDRFDLAAAAAAAADDVDVGGIGKEHGQPEDEEMKRETGRSLRLTGGAAAALGLQPLQAAGGSKQPSPLQQQVLVAPMPVSPIWEDVDAASNAAAGCSLCSLAGLPDYQLCFQGF